MCDLLGSGDEIREDGREHAGAGLDEVCHIDTLLPLRVGQKAEHIGRTLRFIHGFVL